MTIEIGLLQWAVGATVTGFLMLLRYCWLLSARLSTIEGNVRNYDKLAASTDGLDSRLSTVESTVRAHDKFNEALLQRMVSLLIAPHTRELDAILLSIRRGDKLDNEDWRMVHNELEREYEELMKAPPTQEGKDRLFLLVIVIALIAEKRQRL